MRERETQLSNVLPQAMLQSGIDPSWFVAGVLWSLAIAQSVHVGRFVSMVSVGTQRSLNARNNSPSWHLCFG